MQAISLGDYITIEVKPEGGPDLLSSNDKDLPVDGSNLAIKAVELFRNETKKSFHSILHIDKTIPKEAGLGGGSSNAATVLFALNKLLKTDLSDQKLQKMAAKIGSDVPFFFSKGIAKCLGRGDKTIDAQSTFLKKIWLIKPEKESLSTPLVYKNCKPNIYSTKTPEEFFSSFQTSHPLFQNELEYSAFKLLPELKVLKQNIVDAGFETVMMTGSGSTFIAIGKPNATLPDSLWIEEVTPIQRSQTSWYQGDF